MSDEKSINLSTTLNDALNAFAKASKLDDVEALQATGLRCMEAVCDEMTSGAIPQSSPIFDTGALMQRGLWNRLRQELESAVTKYREGDLSAGWSIGDLASVCWLYGECQRSIELWREAGKAHERLLAGLTIKWANTPLIAALLETDAVAEAKEMVDRALAADNDSPRTFLTSTPDLLVLQSRCLIEVMELELAEQSIEAARTFLEKYDTALALFGLQDSIAEYWSATARLHRACGNTNDALEAMQKAIAKRRWIALTPFDHSVAAELRLARVLQTFADDLWRAGRWFKSLAARWESRRLFARFQLDSTGRVPRGVAARLLTRSTWLFDHGLVRLKSFFCRGSPPELEATP